MHCQGRRCVLPAVSQEVRTHTEITGNITNRPLPESRKSCGDSEEAVFVLTKGDPEPTEIGPGIDSERYILHKINGKALKPLRFQDFFDSG